MENKYETTALQELQQQMETEEIESDSPTCVIKKAKISIINKNNLQEKQWNQKCNNNVVTTHSKSANYTETTTKDNLNNLPNENRITYHNPNLNEQNVNLNKNNISGQVTLVQRSEGIVIDKNLYNTQINLSLSTGSPFTCIFCCDKTFYNNIKLKIHYILTHELTYCKLCDVIFECIEEQKKHEEKVHSSKICEICQETIDIENIADHYSEAHDASICQFCSILLYPKCFYNDHVLRKHHANKNFICENNLKNDFANNLKLVNSIEKQTFSCNVCGKIRDREMLGHFSAYHKINTFNLIESLKSQNLVQETLLTMETIECALELENDVKVKCRVCKIEISDENLHSFHLIYCTGKSVCNFCNRVWNHVEYLNSHISEEHSRFNCTLGCDSLAYNSHETLKKHYNNVHEKIICAYCGEFISNETERVENHLTQFHNQKENMLTTKGTVFHERLLLELLEKEKLFFCVLCGENLDANKDVENLVDHFSNCHRMSIKKIVQLIGPNPVTHQDKFSTEVTIKESESKSVLNKEEDEQAVISKWKNFNYKYKVPPDYVRCIYGPHIESVEKDQIVEIKKEVDTDDDVEKNDDLEKNQSFRCDFCDVNFDQNYCKLLEHIYEDHNFCLKDDLEQCTTCTQSNNTNFNIHLENHSNCKCDNNSLNSCLKHEPECHYNEKNVNFNLVRFKCKECNLIYPDTTSIKNHLIKKHRTEINLVCPFCEKLFNKKKYVLQHIKKLHLSSNDNFNIGNDGWEDNYTCAICGKNFKSRKSLKLHKNQSHGRGFKCVICAGKFLSFEERKVHYSKFHPGQLAYECKLCDKTFFSKSGLHRHSKIHDQSLNKCEFCGKEFMSKESFKEHMLIHIGPKHQCSYCPKSFTQKSNLRRHTRLHTGVKPYSCTYCPKQFSDKGACKSHTLVHTREEECHCLICGKKFSKIQKLKYHMKLHTGEGLYDCDLCGKQFTTTYRLRDHRNSHDQKTQYMCECGKSFTKERYLERHVGAVHKSTNKKCKAVTAKIVAKYYKCTLCHNWFSARPSVNKHIKRIHNIPQTEMSKYIECNKPFGWKPNIDKTKLKQELKDEIQDILKDEVGEIKQDENVAQVVNQAMKSKRKDFNPKKYNSKNL